MSEPAPELGHLPAAPAGRLQDPGIKGTDPQAAQAGDERGIARQPWQSAERPGFGPALHELADHPDYDPQWGYGSGFYGDADELRRIIAAARGKPSEMVTIYRVGGEIGPGDWASLSPEYVRDLQPGTQVHHKIVPARHVRLALSDWADEVSYQPDDSPAAATGHGEQPQRVSTTGLAVQPAQLDMPEDSPVTAAAGPPRTTPPRRPGPGVTRGRRP